MKQYLALLLASGVLFSSLPELAASETRPSVSEHRTSLEPQALDEAAGPKVLCSYLVYGVRNSMCGDPPLEDVKKRCDEEATEKRGEKTECACTQDQDFIKDACD